MKRVTPSKLRENIYRILDEVAIKGNVVTVERKGIPLKIVPPKIKSRLACLKKRNIIRGNPENLIHLSWEKAWKPKSF